MLAETLTNLASSCSKDILTISQFLMAMLMAVVDIGVFGSPCQQTPIYGDMNEKIPWGQVFEYSGLPPAGCMFQGSYATFWGANLLVEVYPWEETLRVYFLAPFQFSLWFVCVWLKVHTLCFLFLPLCHDKPLYFLKHKSK